MGGVSMEWKEVRLGDVCSKIGSGATPLGGKEAYKGGDYHLIRSQNVLDFAFSKDGLASINDEQANKLKNVEIIQGDVLLNITGDSVARCCIVPSEILPARVNQHVAIIRPRKEELDNHYLLYYLQHYKRQLLQIASAGATRNAITKAMIENLILPCPKSLDDQRRIASILSSLDRKIELNNKINADLEEMAQAIFKNWFVDFEPFKDGKFVDSELGMIPEGWKVGKITDIDCLITDYVSNGSFASLKQNVHLYEKKEYAQFIRNTDLKTNTFSVYVDKHSYDFLSKSTLYGNEIIISNVGDVGSVHLCPKLDIPMTLGNNIIMLRPNDKEYNYFLYLWFKYFSGQGLIQGIKGGSAQPKFNKTDFKNLPLLIPSFEIIERSYWIFESIFSILSSNVKENSRLSLLRDTLLPRLMSGEIEVPE